MKYTVSVALTPEHDAHVAEVVEMPGLLCWAHGPNVAFAHAVALGLQVLADRLRHDDDTTGTALSISFERSAASVVLQSVNGAISATALAGASAEPAADDVLVSGPHNVSATTMTALGGPLHGPGQVGASTPRDLLTLLMRRWRVQRELESHLLLVRDNGQDELVFPFNNAQRNGTQVVPRFLAARLLDLGGVPDPLASRHDV